MRSGVSLSRSVVRALKKKPLISKTERFSRNHKREKKRAAVFYNTL